MPRQPAVQKAEVASDDLVPALGGETEAIPELPGFQAGLAAAERGDHLVWLDLRAVDADMVLVYVEAALHHGLDGVVLGKTSAQVPPTLVRISFGSHPELEQDDRGRPDIWVVPDAELTGTEGPEVASLVDVVDASSLEVACRRAMSRAWTVLSFADPTKIPLEIVIAAANASAGRTVTLVHDLAEAAVVFGCLERGSDGVMIAPSSLTDVSQLALLRVGRLPDMALTELTVTAVDHIGMGERACLDTCSMLGPDEGVLIGSFASALILTCSETHPLPYMPTRPFRVNAGAVHSYALSSSTRTNYLSELAAGSSVVAVKVDGTARRVALGRVKIERRPLLSISAVAANGAIANIIVQDDWHVRLLGPGGVVLNVTELRPGDVLLGHLPSQARHVGYPIDEFCLER